MQLRLAKIWFQTKAKWARLVLRIYHAITISKNLASNQDKMGPFVAIYLTLTYCHLYTKIQTERFRADKENKQKVPRKNNCRRRWHSDTGKYTNQAETLLHSLEWVTAGTGLHVNAHKKEYMCYNQTGDISTLNGTSLKLVDKFTYLGSSVSSTEKNIDTRLTKEWAAIDKLSIIWKADR